MQSVSIRADSGVVPGLHFPPYPRQGVIIVAQIPTNHYCQFEDALAARPMSLGVLSVEGQDQSLPPWQEQLLKKYV